MGDRPSKRSRADALGQLGYILYRVDEIAPELFRRIEPLLIEGLAEADWELLQSAVTSKLPPPHPVPRKRRH